MLAEKDLQAIAALMELKIQPICNRLDQIDGRLDCVEKRLDQVDKQLEEMNGRLSKLEYESEITRTSVNTLLVWAEDASMTVNVPLLKKV